MNSTGGQLNNFTHKQMPFGIRNRITKMPKAALLLSRLEHIFKPKPPRTLFENISCSRVAETLTSKFLEH